MELPEKNREVPLNKIKEICLAYSLSDLWKKIEQDPPSNNPPSPYAPQKTLHGGVVFLISTETRDRSS